MHCSAGTVTITSPSKPSSGVISTEYVAPVPVKFPAVPFVTPMSPSVKPLTLSENRIVTSNAPCAGKSSQLSIVTVGDVVVFTGSSCFPQHWIWYRHSASTATSAGTVTVTWPWNSSFGVTLTV